MFSIFVVIALFAAFCRGEVWMNHKEIHTSPREEVHQDTSPVFRVWTSKEFLNPMPQPTDLVTSTSETDVEGWLTTTLAWSTEEFPELDLAEYQVWRAQGAGGFSLRGFTSFTSKTFADEKVVYGSRYRYKLRLVTELGMGPFSEIVELTTADAPAGYERPSSKTTSGQRMRAAREAAAAKAKAEAEAAAKAAEEEVEEEEEDEEEPMVFVMSTAATVATPTPEEDVTYTTTGSSSDETNNWSHLTRQNETECSAGDRENGLCKNKSEQATDSGDNLADSWYFKTLLKKVLGNSLTQAS